MPIVYPIMRLPTRKKELEKRYDEPDFAITEAKAQAMKRELQRLISSARPEAVLEVQRTGEMGDFSENAGYQIAKATLRRINAKITVLEDRLARAVIIPGSRTTGFVALGSRVTVMHEKQEQTFHIVGAQEANPSAGRISHRSPLGQALLGKKVGDSVPLTLPHGTVTYTVLRIS